MGHARAPMARDHTRPLPGISTRAAGFQECRDFYVTWCVSSLAAVPLCFLGSCASLPESWVRDRPFVTDCGVVNGSVKKLLQQLQHFQFAENFHRVLQNRFFLDELPQVI